jgi:hypothetical protein
MGAVHVDFGEEGKADAIVFSQKAPISAPARLLGAKLVAGEAQHREAAVLVGAVELFQARVLRGKTAFAGGIDDEQDLAPELVQADRAPVQQGAENS